MLTYGLVSSSLLGSSLMEDVLVLELCPSSCGVTGYDGGLPYAGGSLGGMVGRSIVITDVLEHGRSSVY